MNGKTKVLITGITGMLGYDVARDFLNNNEYVLYGIARNVQKQNMFDEKIKIKSFDLTNFVKTQRELKKINPDIIIHCAANVNLKRCEDYKKMAYRINSEVPKQLASYRSNNTKFIYISSDSVFDGTTGDYSEKDSTNPLNIYAKSKLRGEKNVLSENENSIVIRTNIIGFHNSWGSSLFEWGLEKLINKNEIKGFNDTYFNPVYTKQLANIIKLLIEQTNYTGIINIGSENYISKYDFLLKLANQFGVNNDLIEPASINILNSSLDRPKNTTLNINKLKNVLSLNKNINLDFGLSKLKEDLFNQYVFNGGITFE